MSGQRDRFWRRRLPRRRCPELVRPGVLPDAAAEQDMLLKVRADARQMLDDADAEGSQLLGVADARLHQDLRGLDRAQRQPGIVTGSSGECGRTVPAVGLFSTHDYRRNVAGVYVCFREMNRSG